ncbi:type II toxin-antitoxin system RelE family toxin [Bacillus sp. FSL K6-3431]
MKIFIENIYRLRVGDLRILYRIENNELIIFVLETSYRGVYINKK